MALPGKAIDERERQRIARISRAGRPRRQPDAACENGQHRRIDFGHDGMAPDKAREPERERRRRPQRQRRPFICAIASVSTPGEPGKLSDQAIKESRRRQRRAYGKQIDSPSRIAERNGQKHPSEHDIQRISRRVRHSKAARRRRQFHAVAPIDDRADSQSVASRQRNQRREQGQPAAASAAVGIPANRIGLWTAVHRPPDSAADPPSRSVSFFRDSRLACCASANRMSGKIARKARPR
ncbi:MAG: hypothetical protein BWZ10_01843 [candidate division BRC1 bacterium ADurb.BinA364]|nr:MAG: hypothetical protein BWZ10_01843 [candidate division BRC1 bacterium ADurb.BinA364]